MSHSELYLFNIKGLKYVSSLNNIKCAFTFWIKALKWSRLPVGQRSELHIFHFHYDIEINYSCYSNLTNTLNKWNLPIGIFHVCVCKDVWCRLSLVMGLYIMFGNAFQQHNLSQRITLLYYLQTYDLKV